MSASQGSIGARVGTSACLVGHLVRYDGGHKEHPLLRAGLRPWITLVPVCPESELGLGTPREPIELVKSSAGVRLRACSSGLDHTEAMAGFAQRRLGELVREGLDGFVFKSRSPSCGLAVGVVGATAPPTSRGRFAEAVCSALPLLPVCEEGDLGEHQRLEGFLHRVWTHAWLRQVERPDSQALEAFHERQGPHLAPHAHARLEALLAPGELPRYRSELLGALAISAGG